MTSPTLDSTLMADPAHPAGARRWWGLIAVLTGVFMPILDFFIVNVAIPAIQTRLSATSGQTELIVAGYAVTYAALLVTGGRLGDRLGRRRAFLIGMASFTAASLLCGLAPNANALVAARALQGSTAALLFPQVLALIQGMFEPQERPRAMSRYGVALGLAAAVGQLLGGVLISADLAGLSWRWCFLVNVPVGLVALFAVRALVPRVAPVPGSRLDGVGSALSFLGLVLLILPLTEGRALGWPTWSYLSLGGAAVVLAGFAYHQRWLHRAGGSPLVPPPLFGQRVFRAGLLTVFAFYAGMSAFFFVLALQLQHGQGLSPVQSGLEVTPLALGFFATSLLGRRLADRYGQLSLAAGAVVLLASYAGEYLLTAGDPTHVNRLLLALLLVVNGLGQGLVMAPLIGRVLADIAPEHTGAASGALATVQQVAGAIGVAVVGIVFFSVVQGSGSPARSYSRGFQSGLVYLAITVLATLAGLALLARSTRSAHSTRDSHGH